MEAACDVCVDYNTTALHILQHGSFPQGFSSSSSSAIHRSSLGWTPCHFSLQCSSFSFFSRRKGGLLNKAWLCLLFFSLPLSLCQIPRPVGLTLPSCRAVKVLLFDLIFDVPPALRSVSWRHGNKKGNYTSNKTTS